MRNLKKLFAVLLTVAMLASIMVPALAAEGFKYETEAEQLYDLGLFKGVSDTEYKPELETVLTRETGLVLVIRAMGMEEEVQAMTAEEITAQLAKVEDLDTIYDWAHPYVAYALKTGLTNGIGGAAAGMVKYAGQLELTGKEFVNFMLKGLGYNMDGKWDQVATEAATAGLPVALSVNYGANNAAINRDVAVGLINGFMAAKNSAGVTMAQALVDAGAVDADKMAEYGYFTPTVAPTEAPIVLTAEASTDNLIQIYVVYNQEVDKDTAEDVENYEIEDVTIDSAKLQDDGVTVVLTLDLDGDGMDQQSEAELVIKNVKDLNDEVIEKTTVNVEFLDMAIPEVVDAEVVGNNTFKVTFSEPMKVVEKDEFVVNNGKMYVKKITLQNNNTEALVEMYSTLKEGEITFQVKSGNEDYAGFGVIGKLFTLQVVPDEEEPVVIGYEGAKRNKVTLLWNEDIQINATLNADGELVAGEALGDFYHTNSKNPATKVTKDGNKLTLEFGDDDENWLPAGTAYVYVAKDRVKDFWNNKNTQQMIKVEVEVDEVAPVVDEIEVIDEDTIEVKFDEALDSDSAEDEDNYVVLNDEGKEVENIINRLDYVSADKKVTIDFYDELNGDYTLVIEGVEDIFGNEMAETAVPFTVGDETAPIPAEDFSATLYNPGSIDQMIKINFGEKMALEGKYAVDDVEKYVINNKALDDYKDYELDVIDDGEVVEISIPAKDKDGKVTNGTIPTGATVIEVARVADAADNYTTALTFNINLVGSTDLGFARNDQDVRIVEATAVDKVKIKFSDDVVKFDVADILVSTEADPDDAAGNKIEIAGIDTELDGGKTVVYITLGEDLPYYLNGTAYVHIVGTSSENAYGDKFAEDTAEILDKIAPEVVEDGIVFATTGNTITIEFSEDLDESSEAVIARYAHDLVVVNRDGDTLVALDDYETTVVENNKLVVTITDVDPDEGNALDKYSIQSKDTVNYIKDLNGNKAAKFDRVKN